MTPLYPGQLCFVTGVPTDPALVGLPVTVIGRVRDPDDPHTEWHRVESAMLASMYPGRDVHIRRANLRPMHPDALLPGVSTPEGMEK